MATKVKVTTPPLISFGSYTTFMNELREHGDVPSRIDKTLLPRASGSQTSGMLAALKFLGHTDEAGRPSDEFKALVMANEDARKPLLEKLVKDRYSFLFNDPNFNLGKATSGEMTEKFRSLDISGSTLTKTITFFLAMSKEAGVKVSSHIKPPPAPKSATSSKKIVKATPDATNTDVGEEEEEEIDVERFEIPIPGKSSVKVIVPNDLDADDWEMLQSMITVYIKRWKGFQSKGEK